MNLEKMFDQYTLLHFAVGIVAYFWNISFVHSFVLHTLFEYAENTKFGMFVINKYIKMWPGGKPSPDPLINSIGDTVGFILGWLIAQQLDKFGSKREWYTKHIN